MALNAYGNGSYNWCVCCYAVSGPGPLNTVGCGVMSIMKIKAPHKCNGTDLLAKILLIIVNLVSKRHYILWLHTAQDTRNTGQASVVGEMG